MKSNPSKGRASEGEQRAFQISTPDFNQRATSFLPSSLPFDPKPPPSEIKKLFSSSNLQLHSSFSTQLSSSSIKTYSTTPTRKPHLLFISLPLPLSTPTLKLNPSIKHARLSVLHPPLRRPRPRQHLDNVRRSLRRSTSTPPFLSLVLLRCSRAHRRRFNHHLRAHSLVTGCRH